MFCISFSGFLKATDHHLPVSVQVLLPSMLGDPKPRLPSSVLSKLVKMAEDFRIAHHSSNLTAHSADRF